MPILLVIQGVYSGLVETNQCSISILVKKFWKFYWKSMISFIYCTSLRHSFVTNVTAIAANLNLDSLALYHQRLKSNLTLYTLSILWAYNDLTKHIFLDTILGSRISKEAMLDRKTLNIERWYKARLPRLAAIPVIDVKKTTSVTYSCFMTLFS